MNYTKINKDIQSKLEAISGTINVIADRALMENYTRDEYALDILKSYPGLVVKPRNTQEVSEILKLANEQKFPVYPRGGGTGLCGACVPMLGGVLLLFDNMKKVIEVDTDNIMAVVECGIPLSEFYKEIEKHGLFFPPHPGDDSATIGGVIATNAGGTRAVKLGVVRNYVKGLEVVLPTGEIINIGGKLMKNSTGYSLLNLLIGAEGTLGIVTKATINLLPPPQCIMTLVVPFESLNDAIKTVPEIIRAKITPLAVEFIEKDVLVLAEKYLDRKWPASQGQAYLMIIVDGDDEDSVFKTCEKISDVCKKNNAIDAFIADSKEKQKDILYIRSHLYEVIKKYMIEDLDIVVPRARIADLVERVHEIEKKYKVWLPTYGHAADGNVHIHLLRAIVKDGVWIETDKKIWEPNYGKINNELHGYAKSIGGQVSGEHGIGIKKKKYLKSFLEDKHIQLMKDIKKVFDPNNILNPGKIFDL
ncbi:MAG: hypothetical protein A2252_12035 [Elusimicrobia bacterium RIFOXYA2_FULL_39_19]|nr:MAG: hypothetical protein A2252_12035 [Elusimicrobia bacterium RIFOXYA2_FULL_39_19]